MKTAYETEYAHGIAGCITTPMRRPRLMRMQGEKVSAFINAPSTDEIIFTKNATEA